MSNNRPRQRSPTGTLLSHRSASSMSSATNDQLQKQQQQLQQQYSARPSTAHSTTAPSGLTNFSRPQPRQSIDAQVRLTSAPPAPLSAPGTAPPGSLRSRQHSQGFFEPSLAHSSHMSASQIAAQAAMHHIHSPPTGRKRPAPPLQPINVAASHTDRRLASPSTLSPPPPQTDRLDGRLTATTAANAAFPRSPGPLPSPHALTADQPVSAPLVPSAASETKTKERSKMKLFHKPKSIGIAKDKDKAAPALPSPSRGLLRADFASASMTSLTEPNSSSAASVYSSANTSTTTLVPAAATATADKDKEKHRHHFLSRPKQKEHRALPLSSASSNSTAVDPSAPQSLYSFTPQSPGFSKSVSGLDLRHGGRALREKKKEEKAAAAAASTGLTQVMSNSSSGALLRDDSRSEFLGPSSLDSNSILGPPSNTGSVFSFPALEQTSTMTASAFNSLGSSMGLHGITADDAWPLLKARLLNIFSGEDLRTPIEDFNLLVSVHIRRCIQKRAPVVLVEDLRELLATGFSSLAQLLRGVPDERLVPRLVEIWHTTFSSILPFIQAVFLPLDLEFRGRGTIMTQREAAEFWGAFVPAEPFPPPLLHKPSSSFEDIRPSSSGGATISSSRMPGLGEELDVRRIALIVFRDVVLLPRHESLLAIFSRLSLDSINTTPLPTNLSSSPPISSSSRGRGFSNPAAGGAERPSTGGSLSPRLGSSYNSQTSTLDAISSSWGHSRSRATSNTSAGSFGTNLPHHAPQQSIDSVTSAPSSNLLPAGPVQLADPAQVTQTVGRMLQCVSVVASVQTADQAQGMVERLTRELKYNWLGRGRTGRQRRGWVGIKSSRGAGNAGAGNGLGVVGA